MTWGFRAVLADVNPEPTLRRSQPKKGLRTPSLAEPIQTPQSARIEETILGFQCEVPYQAGGNGGGREVAARRHPPEERRRTAPSGLRWRRRALPVPAAAAAAAAAGTLFGCHGGMGLVFSFPISHFLLF